LACSQPLRYTARHEQAIKWLQGRHYAGNLIDGDDLHVLSRWGDHRAGSVHHGNLLTIHTIRDFRQLVY